MNKSSQQVAIVDGPRGNIIGLQQITEIDGIPTLSNACRVSLRLSIMDERAGKSIPIFVDTEIPANVLYLLKSGKTAVDVKLAPLSILKNESDQTTVKSECGRNNRVAAGNTPIAADTNRNTSVPTRFAQDSAKIPAKAKTYIQRRLGTSGTKKYYQGIEVSWGDVVVHAKEKLGKDVSLSGLYEWAENNVTWMKDGSRTSVSSIKNWRASIRQNRKAGKLCEKFSSQSETHFEDKMTDAGYDSIANSGIESCSSPEKRPLVEDLDNYLLSDTTTAKGLNAELNCIDLAWERMENDPGDDLFNNEMFDNQFCF